MTRNAIIFSKNQKICKLIANELLLADFSVKTSSEPQKDVEGLYDVIIIDTTSLELSALTFMRSLLSRNATSVKICICENEEVQKSLWGFNKYLSFPFRLEELRSALVAPQANERKNDAEQSIDTPKCFFAHKDRRGITLEGTYIPLSQYEFNTLELLCSNAGKCVSRESIRSTLNSTDGNIADVYISHLRSKLELPFGLKIIYTVRSKGYMTDYILKEYLP